MTNLETLLLAMLGNKGGGGEGGTTNYNELDNRPQVNGITLTGNKDSEDLNLVDVDMIGVSYGVAALDEEGKVPKSQLPPYPNYDTEIQNINKALEGKAEQSSVSALEEKVDKKANKTFIEAVDSETSVVTVPEGTSFAAISKISGKTVKDGEVLKSALVKSVVSCGENMVKGNNILSGAFLNSFPVDIKSGTEYKLSFTLGGGSYVSVTINHSDGTSTRVHEQTYGSAGRKTVTFTPSKSAVSISASLNSAVGVSDIALTSTGKTDYIPYNKTTVSIPQEILDLPDYGIEGNVLDLENMKYYHNYKEIDLSDLSYVKWQGGKGSSYLYVTSPSLSDKKLGNYNILTSKYTTPTTSTTYEQIESGYIIGRSDITALYIRDDKFTGTADDFKSYVNGVKLVYELATPEVIDLTTILYPFAVESGGTIEFVNEHNLDVPNTVLYKKEVL